MLFQVMSGLRGSCRYVRGFGGWSDSDGDWSFLCIHSQWVECYSANSYLYTGMWGEGPTYFVVCPD